MKFQHYPVMNKDVIDVFRDTRATLFIDCTVGMGGHSWHILNSFKAAEVIALDVDQDSLKQAKENLIEFKDRVHFYSCSFTELFERIDLSSKEVSGVLVDPGISTYQLKSAERGFSHNIDSPLDMRKDKETEITAYDVINKYTEKQLTNIFEKYGEIWRAKELSKKIIEKRLFNKIDSTFKLKEIIGKMYRWKPQAGKLHPAARVFQALRIYVNHELEGFEEFLEKLPNILNKGSRIIILTFHSLEDRIVKTVFNNFSQTGLMKLIPPFPGFPSEDECRENPPSRPTKLRAGEII
jgi:16S rRNA (cytosine1402-N4)-methyltransferase